MTETTHNILEELVDKTEYRPGWRVSLANIDDVLTLKIMSVGYDSYHPDQGRNYRVLHLFQVPPATYNKQTWTRWLLDCYIKVETHEACEFFVVDGKRPFAPNHGPGWDPYGVRELNRVEDAETRFTGERVEGSQQ